MSSPSCVITGASTGIGHACALRLDRAGWRVLAGVRRAEDAARLRAELSERSQPVIVDVTDAVSIADAAAKVTSVLRDDGLAGLVNNAGIAVAGPLEFLPLDEFRRQLEVNVTGQLAVTQACLPAPSPQARTHRLHGLDFRAGDASDAGAVLCLEIRPRGACRRAATGTAAVGRPSVDCRTGRRCDADLEEGGRSGGPVVVTISGTRGAVVWRHVFSDTQGRWRCRTPGRSGRNGGDCCRARVDVIIAAYSVSDWRGGQAAGAAPCVHTRSAPGSIVHAGARLAGP